MQRDNHPTPMIAQDASNLLNEEIAWQLHEEVRALARQQLRRTQVDESVTPATMGDTLKRFIEQVTGSPVSSTVRSAVSKRL